VQEGLEQDEEVAGWLAKKWDQELVIQLRVQILEERVSISAEEIRREYDETPDRYTQPEQIEIQEILVDTEEEAQKLLERIQQGESIGELARKYSIRPPELRDEEGRRRFSTADGPVYGRLVSAAWKTPVDQFGGPLHVHEGYSVFKVLSRKREPASFEESKKRARAIVNWNKKQQVFDQFITGLRTKYAEQVTVREDNLKLAFAAE
jgi:parvulin-like peptidyl-prolyl isomerase